MMAIVSPTHERPIDGQITVATGHPAPADAPLASQRAELLGQLAAAQFDLEKAIGDLIRSGSGTSMAQSQLHSIAQLQRQVGTADPAGLASLRSSVAATIAETQAFTQLGRDLANGSDATNGATLATLASHAQAQASSFMRDARQYDALLQFESEAERDAYRAREEERRKRFDEETAKGTPEGNLNAAGAALGQATDLAVHGGSADPAFMRRVDEFAASTAALRAQMIRDGQDVSKFDNALRDDLRAIMRAKGIPDDRIEALLAAHRDNPIEAMTAFVNEHRDSISTTELDALSAKVKESVPMPKNEGFEKVSAPSLPSGALVADITDAVADLKALGIVVADHDGIGAPTHGVTANASTSTVRGATIS